MEDSEEQSLIGSKTIIHTQDAKRQYTLEAIQALYVLCSDPIEKFSERYNPSPALVLRFAQAGKWDDCFSLGEPFV